MNGFRNVRADEIDCRVATVKANGLSLLLYKDARCDQNILDETVGFMNWKNEYSRDNANCTVSIWDEGKKQWISKENTGTESFTEKEKGLASDSFKRACFNWGIGRELYTAPFIWIKAEFCDIKPKSQGYTCYDRFIVGSIGYDDLNRINELTILDKNGKEVYSLKPKQSRTQPHTTNETTAVSNLSDEQIKSLYGLLAKNSVPPNYITQVYKVNSVKDLTPAQLDNITQFIDKIKAQYEEFKNGK